MVAVVGLASLFITILYGWWGSRLNNDVTFYSPGPISQTHVEFANDCVKCHDPKATPMKRTIAQSSMDAACLKCHAGHTLHQPDVARDHACVQCHQEHATSGPMLATDSVNCISCHGDAANMLASAARGRSMPTDAFHQVPADGRIYFLPKRPVDGYTTVMTAFDDGHPAFQIQRDNLIDPDTLKFNHARHFQADIPPTAEGSLTCASCHRPDATGAYLQRISFERDCESCHSLQFDRRNPDLTIPHGNPEIVISFLRTLPLQYSQLAAKRGIQGEAAVTDFVQKQLVALQGDVTTGDQLEEEVFFSGLHSGLSLRVGHEKDVTTRNGLTGCAYCHEVNASATGTPVVTAPVIPDRWYSRAKFDHARHATLTCASCHAAEQSTKTADILLPPQSNCLQCHSAKGGVVQTCTTCHTYHASVQTVAASSLIDTTSLRAMFLSPDSSPMPKDSADKTMSR
jgi:predicted CXXCH cytochrome family protein